MKEKTKKIIDLLNQWKTFLMILFMGVGLFYWYEIKPKMLYSYCNEKAMKQAQEQYKEQIESQNYITQNDKEKLEKGYYLSPHYESYFERCLREKGINQ